MEEIEYLYEAAINKLKERLKNRVPCKECKHCGNAGIFGVCNNEKSDAFKHPVRYTSSCIYGEARE